MKTILIKSCEIKNLLDKIYSTCDDKKTKLVLITSERDDFVRRSIESWVEEKEGMDLGLYLFGNELLGLDETLIKSNVGFAYRDGTFDEKERNDQRNLTADLKNRRNAYSKSNLKLMIFNCLNPAWSSNNPLYDVNDVDLFDEIYEVVLDAQSFLTVFTNEANSRILSIMKAKTIETEESTLNTDWIPADARTQEEKNKIIEYIRKEIEFVQFILNHKKFAFKKRENTNNYLSPLGLYDVINFGFSKIYEGKKIPSIKRLGNVGGNEQILSMLNEIILDYIKEYFPEIIK